MYMPILTRYLYFPLSLYFTSFFSLFSYHRKIILSGAFTRTDFLVATCERALFMSAVCVSGIYINDISLHRIRKKNVL